MAQAASKTCEICVAALGEFFCQQCDQLFCQGCKTAHLRSKISKSHVFLHGPNINTEVKFHCEQHDELFIFHCVPCNTPVCKVCAVEIHNGHKMSQLEKYTEGLQKEVHDKIEIFMKTHESNLSMLKNNTTKYQEEVQTTVRAITNEGNQLKQLIDSKVSELIKSVKEDETKQLKTLSQIQKDFRITLEKLKGYNQQLETLKEGPADGAMNRKLDQLKSEVELINNSVLPVIPTVRYTDKGATTADINQLFGTVSTAEIKHPRDGSRLQEKPDIKHPRGEGRLQEKPTMQSGKYLYRCLNCGTEQWSNEVPRSSMFSRSYVFYGAFLHCDKCGWETAHQVRD